jgi:hypothetical protein
VEQTRLRCADQPNVEVICADLRKFIPDAPLDLIVFSEIGYFFSTEELSQMAGELTACLVPDGEFLAAHWLGDSPNHVLHGDRVHEILAQHLALCPLRSERHAGFRLDSWIKS